MNNPTILTEIVHPNVKPVKKIHFHHLHVNGCFLWLWNLTKHRKEARVKNKSMESNKINLPKVAYEFSKHTKIVNNQVDMMDKPIALPV